MPTEQLGGTVDATSDLYALGATLLHAATGKAPSEMLSSDFSLTVAAGVPLRDLIAWLVQPRRERRPRSAEAALHALDHPARRPVVRLRFAVAAAAALTAAILSAWVPRVPASAAIGPRTPRGTPAQRWVGQAKPVCQPGEGAQFIARQSASPCSDC